MCLSSPPQVTLSCTLLASSRPCRTLSPSPPPPTGGKTVNSWDRNVVDRRLTAVAVLRRDPSLDGGLAHQLPTNIGF